MSAPRLPAPVPPINPETRDFWDATRQGRLLLPRCDACATVFWYPRGACPECGSASLSWLAASGGGSIYSFSVTYRGQGEYEAAGPYVLAYVELEEGPRMLTNIVECDPEALSVGQAVELILHDTGGGAALPRFRPLVSDDD